MIASLLSLWSHSGMNPCDERTRTPLHTQVIEDNGEVYGWEGCLDALSEVAMHRVPTLPLQRSD